MPRLTQADKAFIVWDAVREIINGQYEGYPRQIWDAIYISLNQRKVYIGNKRELDEVFFRISTCVGLIAGFHQPEDYHDYTLQDSTPSTAGAELQPAGPSVPEVLPGNEEGRPRSLR